MTIRKSISHNSSFVTATVRSIAILFVTNTISSRSSLRSFHNCQALAMEYYRADGVRITHDPYEPGMSSKYGEPGQTDDEGFDPYRDTVGPGIYGGVVERDEAGAVKIGRQYQNHNTKPGPVYSGGGYTPIVRALKGGSSGSSSKLVSLLEKHPDLVNDVSTGGAQPLHMCGMGKENQRATKILVQNGADIEALDTYGMTPLMRMASNNLAEGARMLLEAGADVGNGGRIGSTAVDIGKESRATEVLKVLEEFSAEGIASGCNIEEVHVDGADVLYLGENGMDTKEVKSREITEVRDINGAYKAQDGTLIPESFRKVCVESSLGPAEKLWSRLNRGAQWYKHTENNSYIYRNSGDGEWWVDGPSGLGVFIANTYRGTLAETAVPAHDWEFMGKTDGKTIVVVPPTVKTFRRVKAWAGV